MSNNHCLFLADRLCFISKWRLEMDWTPRKFKWPNPSTISLLIQNVNLTPESQIPRFRKNDQRLFIPSIIDPRMSTEQVQRHFPSSEPFSKASAMLRRLQFIMKIKQTAAKPKGEVFDLSTLKGYKREDENIAIYADDLYLTFSLDDLKVLEEEWRLTSHGLMFGLMEELKVFSQADVEITGEHPEFSAIPLR